MGEEIAYDYEFIEENIGSVRSYFCTWNNYPGNAFDIVKQYIIDNVDYGLLCREVAPTTGTNHLHFYLYFSNKKAWNSLKKDFPKANIQRAKGTAQQNYKYITKADKDYFEFGERPTQGKRSDISTIYTAVKAGAKVRDIIPIATSMQSLKAAEFLMKYVEPQRNWSMEVHWFHGPTGSGKTLAAWRLYPQAYNKPAGKWWDGYDGHSEVIIDDFREGDIPFVELLKLFHEHPHQVEVKGGYRQFLAKKIVITTPHSPMNTFLSLRDEDFRQLTRRISEVKFFSGT